jgi:hypothetical protein
MPDNNSTWGLAAGNFRRIALLHDSTLSTSGGTITGNLAIGGNLTVAGTTALDGSTATTPATANNSTAIATTAFVKAQGYGTGSVTSITAGTGLTGGTITASGTFALDATYVNAHWLPITGGTLSGPGNLSVGGTLGVTGAATLTRSLCIGPPSDPGPLGMVINDTATVPQGYAVRGRLTVASETTNPMLLLDGYGPNTNYPSILPRVARGTAAAPAAMAAGDSLFLLAPQGYNGTAYAGGPGISIATTEAWTAAHLGSQINLNTVPAGTTTVVSTLILNGNAATFSGSVTSGGSTAGFVFNDRSGGQPWLWSAASPYATLNYNGTLNTIYTDNAGNFTASGATATKPGGGPWVAPSSRELKQEITPYREGLQAVLALNPVRYRYNGLAGLPQEMTYVGLVADEAHGDLVGRATLHIDATKEPVEIDTVDAGPLVYMLVNAVKELAARVAELEANQ